MSTDDIVGRLRTSRVPSGGATTPSNWVTCLVLAANEPEAVAAARSAYEAHRNYAEHGDRWVDRLVATQIDLPYICEMA